MLELDDDWAWDFWVADDGIDFHLFFLTAPRSLGDPQLRHLNASVGHAVSPDLSSWTRLPNALTAGVAGPDSTATWTGSVVRSLDGSWQMFYTGMAARRDSYDQVICRATSPDLLQWHKDPRNPILEPDPRWYLIRPAEDITDWRDPWVFRDPDGAGWHMLFTATAQAETETGPESSTGSGVVGHAVSSDLGTWQATPPLSRPNAGFEWLEVTQVEVVDGRVVLIFSCLPDKFAGRRRECGQTGGVWAVSADSVLGPFDVAAAYPVTDDRFYSGRLVQTRSGEWALMAFHNTDVDGRFVGAVSDPMPVHWRPDVRLEVRAG
jgi:beta-fructofuranosidase